MQIKPPARAGAYPSPPPAVLFCLFNSAWAGLLNRLLSDEAFIAFSFRQSRGLADFPN